MIPPRPTELAQMILRTAIQPGNVVIDATAGNGHDTLFLAGCVGHEGKVHAFDIQTRAIESARARVTSAGFQSRVVFHQTCHSNMMLHVLDRPIAAVMFNLGYLPGEDHSVCTRSTETVAGIEAVILMLAERGLLSVVCYPGHDAGAIEAEVVESRFHELTKIGWRIARYAIPGTIRPSPFLLLGCKP